MKSIMTAHSHHRQPWHPRSLLMVHAILMAIAALVATAPSADAYRQWCRTDPVVMIDGVVADIFVSGPLTAPTLVTGPNKIVVMTPPDIDGQLVVSTLGFGRGEDISFVESTALRSDQRGIELRIKVYVPAVKAMRVRVEFAPRIVGILNTASIEGRANSWVVLKTVL